MITSFILIKSNLQQVDDFESKINSLLTGEILGVIFHDFYKTSECQSIVKNMTSQGFSWFNTKIDGYIGIGMPFFERSEIGREKYFLEIRNYQQLKKEIFSKYRSPTERIFDKFKPFFPFSVAVCNKYGEYYTDIIFAQKSRRNIHVDRVKYEFPKWNVASIIRQFSSVVYFQVPEIGGALEIFNRHWVNEDKALSKSPTRLELDDNLLQGVESLKYFPKIGELILFQTGFYHRVLDSLGDKHRISCNTFFGLEANGSVIFFV
jgi:hypothetical protein